MSLADPRTVPAPHRLIGIDRWFALLRDAPFRFRRPVAGGAYRAEIDGLRFVAIAIVVVGHYMERAVRFFPQARVDIEGNAFAALFLRPGLGVYLFFTISGFIIASQVIKVKASPLSARFLRTYFGRRILRIEPPYVILLVATWFALSVSGFAPSLTNHFDEGPQSLSLSLVGSIFYLHDLVWGVYPRLFPPGWSLEAEVQFYVLAPLLFWAYFRLKRGPRRIALGGFGLLVGALLSLNTPTQIGPLHTDVSLLRFFHFFWLGILLADLHGWIVVKTEGMPGRVTSLIGWGGLVAYLVLPSAPDDNLLLALLDRAAAYATIAAMFVSAFAQGSGFRAFCVRPWISLVGGACYSIYLVHLQTIQALTSIAAKLVPTGGIATLLIALIVEASIVLVVGLCFYVVIERTFMIADWPRLFWRRALRVVKPAALKKAMRPAAL